MTWNRQQSFIKKLTSSSSFFSSSSLLFSSIVVMIAIFNLESIKIVENIKIENNIENIKIEEIRIQNVLKKYALYVKKKNFDQQNIQRTNARMQSESLKIVLSIKWINKLINILLRTKDSKNSRMKTIKTQTVKWSRKWKRWWSNFHHYSHLSKRIRMLRHS
jgi:TPP-dependent trihydroxycyclohexane-1,2-dione (THcHDO) dehydratase